MMDFKILACIFALFLYIANVDAYFITVDAHAEECFFDKVETGTKMGKLLRRLGRWIVEVLFWLLKSRLFWFCQMFL